MNARNILKISALMAAMGMVVSTGAIAGDSATQDVGYEVEAINEIAVTGTPSLTINATNASVSAGDDSFTVTDNSSRYAITTNGSNKKITAAITTGGDMPDGVTLSVTAGGTGAAGKQSLSTTAADIATGLTTIAESDQTLTYELTALVTAGVVASASKTVTLTIVDGGGT
jgi:hypothetical protein